MKKITLIFAFFFALNAYTQHTLSGFDIVEETFDSNGCTTSINLEFTLNHSAQMLSGPPTWIYTLWIENGQGSTFINVEYNYDNGYLSTHTTGNILITESTEIKLLRDVGGRRGRGVIKSAIIIRCVNDIDEDGVLDDIDNCPNHSNPNQSDADGDGIGDVCDDTDNSALPNLTLGGFSVKVDGTTYNAASQLPVFKKGAQHEFNITIENNDDGLAENVSFRLFVSSSVNAYPNSTSTPVYQYHSNTNNVGDINGNSEATFTFNDYIYDWVSSLELQENTDYYMFVHVDYDEDIDESNENDSDNIIPIRFRWDDPAIAGRRVHLKTSNGLIEVPLDNNADLIGLAKNALSSFNLKIYNFYNIRVLNQNIQDGQTVDVSYLKGGIYIVHINDVYVKKFITGKELLFIK